MNRLILHKGLLLLGVGTLLLGAAPLVAQSAAAPARRIRTPVSVMGAALTAARTLASAVGYSAVASPAAPNGSAGVPAAPPSPGIQFPVRGRGPSRAGLIPQRTVPAPVPGRSVLNWTPTPGGGASAALTFGGRALGARVFPGVPTSMRLPIPSIGGLHVVQVVDTGTSKIEYFLLQVPNLGFGSPVEVPLLVAFHGYSVSPYDITINTTFSQEAIARSWYLLAPMGGWERNLSSTESQINHKVALDLVCAVYNIDLDRIYAVGFSMGAGNALNFASRYTDLRGPRFAGIVNHTGLLAQEHAYTHAPANCSTPPCPRTIYHNRYGGSPAQVPFEYKRASVAPIPYVVGFPSVPPVDTTQDFARNLLDIPIRSYVGQNDPLSELIVQNYAFELYMASLGADHVLTIVPGVTTHSWNTIDETSVCNWLATESRVTPTQGDTHADRDGRWFYFDLLQQTPGNFSRFAWDYDSMTATLTLDATENVDTLGVDTVLLGLDAAADFTLILQPGDNTADAIVVQDVPQVPAMVLRDGISSATWTYDAQNLELRLTETDSTSAHTWFVDM